MASGAAGAEAAGGAGAGVAARSLAEARLDGDRLGGGASGGIAGLMGAASRMVPPHHGRLASLRSAPVLTMAAAWLGVNLVFALIGFSIAGGGAPLAWQAHLAGYALGVLGIGPALALNAGPRDRG